MNKINILFKYIFSYITLQLTLNSSSIYSINNYINSILTFLNLNVLLLTELISKLHIYSKNQKIQIQKLNILSDKLSNIHLNLLEEYNNISKSILQEEKTEIILDKATKYNLNSINNLDLYELDNLDDLLNNNIIYSNNDNYIKDDYINIGFNNYYKLSIYKNLNGELPFNTLIYVKELDQIVMKIGEKNNFRFINSKLYKIYNIKNENNSKSIICNNNIKDLNKKCNIPNCKFYHDYIIGYKDNADIDRQFSYNPIVYNCLDFKDGSKVKENTKKIKWYDAINLYQANLSCLLIACIHSMQKS